MRTLPSPAFRVNPPADLQYSRKKEGKRTALIAQGRFWKLLPGNDLLSHALSHAVPSALRGLTAVFGMGTGVSPSPQSPEKANF